MSEGRSTLRSSFSHLRNYLAGGVAAKAIGVVSLPVMTRILEVEDYGTVHLVSAYVAILSVLSTLGSTQGVARHYFEDTDDFPSMLGTALALSLGLQALFFAGLFATGLHAVGWSGIPADAFWLVIPLNVALVLRNLFDAYGKVSQQSRMVAAVQVVAAYASFGAAVAFALARDTQRYLGVLTGQALVGVLVATFVVVRLLRVAAFAPAWSQVRYLLAYGLPLVPGMLSQTILGQLDRVMIGSYSGVRDAGLYSLAYNIGALLAILTLALRGAFAPLYFEHMRQGRFEAVDREQARLMRIIVAAAIALCGGAKYVGTVLSGRDFHEGFVIIPAVVLGYAFLGMFGLCQYSISFSKRTYLSSAVVVVSGVVNVALNAAFIPRYGYQAAAYTTLASYALMAVLCWAVGRRALDCHTTPFLAYGRPLAMLVPFLALYIPLANSDVSLLADVVLRLGLVAVCGWLLLRNDLQEVLMAKKRPPGGT